MIDFPKARLKMVEEQITSRGIKEAKLIAAMKKIPRHLFVEEASKAKPTPTILCPLEKSRPFPSPTWLL
jgi:protein-L-isoaspartate(D-aspartate) O-methyltransferase